MPEVLIGGTGGGLEVLINGKRETIMEYTEIKTIKVDEKNKRYYFVICEGKFNGKRAEVNINDGFAKRMKCISYKSGVHLIFSKTRQTKNNKGILKFKNGKKTYEAIISSNILKNGRYELEFADSFHKSNEFYRKEARLYRVWFRIASNDGTKDRYLHTGSFSRGCITVTDVEYWDEICDILRKSRLKKGVVGIVEVTD